MTTEPQASEARTMREATEALAPGLGWAQLVEWPPDAFAVAAAILADSGAYRVVISPPDDLSWPPQLPMLHGREWAEAMRELGDEWAAATPRPGSTAEARPTAVDDIAAILDRHGDVPLNELAAAKAEPEISVAWEVAGALVSLVAMADEACAGLHPAVASVLPFHMNARQLLDNRGSLSQLAPDRICVLPKLRVPQSGITIRSLTRYIAFERSEVAASWQGWKPAAKRGAALTLDEAPGGIRERTTVSDIGVADDHFTMLLVPWPYRTAPTDFHSCSGPLTNMDSDRYGFFEYMPRTPFDEVHVATLVSTAQARVGHVDMVILPEAVLTEAEAQNLGKRLRPMGVPFLVAGARGLREREGRLGTNFAYVASEQAPVGQGRIQEIRQRKHHRWFLNRSQIEQYHLGPVLDPNRIWWEAIDVSPRELSFIEIRDWLTVCPLVCEDLARPDPVASLLRAVGPSLVIALLLDGPQLEARWPGRYATVLADDPGCAVLTLSSFGLVQRCRPAKRELSRVVGLWKDRHGARELELDSGVDAIALTVSRQRSTGTCADGRRERTSGTYNAVLSGIEPIELPTRRSAGGVESGRPLEPAAPA